MNFPNQSFAPFFDEIVKISATRGSQTISGGFRACVMPVQDAEALFDGSVQSTRPRFSVLVASSGNQAWIEAAIRSRPQIGDVVELKSGLVTAVRKVNPVVDAWYEIEVEQA